MGNQFTVNGAFDIPTASGAGWGVGNLTQAQREDLERREAARGTGSVSAVAPDQSGASWQTNAIRNEGTAEHNAYNWGGTPEAAERDVARARNLTDLTDQRSAPTADYKAALEARGLGMQARGSQQDALGMYRDAAAGRGPSAAQSQFQQAVDQAMRASQSQAASVRGTGVQRAAAQMQGINAASGMMQQGAAGAAALRAQEQQSAMAGYSTAAGQMRQGDTQLQGVDAAMAQFQAQQQLASRNANDSRAMQYENMANQIATTQMQGQISRQDAIARGIGLEQSHQQINNSKNAADDATARALTGAALSTAGAVGGAFIGGPAGAAAGGAAGSAAGKAVSDRRAKNVKGDDDSSRESFYKALEGASKSWTYKGSSDEHIGPMAQDIEKAGPIGRAMVKETPQGKVVDYGHALATMLSEQLDQRSKIDELLKKAVRK